MQSRVCAVVPWVRRQHHWQNVCARSDDGHSNPHFVAKPARSCRGQPTVCAQAAHRTAWVA
eukprot:539097-Alexandrium_andersonii.AAC.1